MFLTLNHQQLAVYKSSRSIVLECYLLTAKFPNHERFSLFSQIRRAAISIHLNISEGASRRSLIERKRFYEIARGSLIEVDTALDIALELKYLEHTQTKKIAEQIINTFKLLSGMIKSSSNP